MSFGVKSPIPFVQINGATTASYTASAEDLTIDVIAVPNSDVTVTLPLASAVGRGGEILVTNSDGSCSSPANINVVRGGSDTVNGGTGYAMASAYLTLYLVSDGVSKWTRAQG